MEKELEDGEEGWNSKTEVGMLAFCVVSRKGAGQST
jgi:hypothetical protein